MAYVMGRNVGDFELIAKWYPLTHSKPQRVDFGSCSNFQLKTLSAHCVLMSLLLIIKTGILPRKVLMGRGLFKNICPSHHLC